MLRVSIFLSILVLSAAVNLKYSVILTSADVPIGQPQSLDSLQKDNSYRIYATFASGNTDDYAKNVKIYDSTGATLTVAGLAQPKPNSGYFLDNMRYLRAPITVHDQNTAGTARVPFTIYVVDQSITPCPVVSAALVSNNGEVDSNNGFIAAGITVLSAEEYFTMYNLDIGNLASMWISSVGYDDGNAAYNVMNVNSPSIAHLSFLTVYGPAATLFNTNWGINARFKFQFNRNTKFDTPLAPGASFTFMSPGYLSTDKSYNIPYTAADALDRSYSFGANNLIETQYYVNDFQNQEKINIQFTTAENSVTDLGLTSSANSAQVQWANQISMKVDHPNGDHVPRFLIQVTSGSSISFSILGVLLVSLFSKFY